MAAKKDTYIQAVKVLPQAQADSVVGWRGEELLVKIRAAPEKGKANRALVEFLAAALDLAKSEIVVLRGETSRHKLVQMPARAQKNLAALVDKGKSNS